MRSNRQSGFTIIEALIALVILTLLLSNISMVTKTGSAAAESSIFRETLTDQLDQTLDRVSMAIMSSSATGLDPLPVAPASSPTISYKASLGMVDEQIVFGDQENISWIAGGPSQGQVIWTRRPGELTQQQLVWSNWVPTFFLGELANGGDDNGNGLMDESGLSFDTNGDEVFVRVTVQRVSPNGNVVPLESIRNVTCRN